MHYSIISILCKPKRYWILGLMAIFVIGSVGTAQTDDVSERKRTIVFLGKRDIDYKPQYRATGFLYRRDTTVYLVTAKHVIVKKKDDKFTNELKDQDLVVFFNTQSHRISSRTITELKISANVVWLFHDSVEVDIAILHFGTGNTPYNILPIPESYVRPSVAIEELSDVYYLSYQPGLVDTEKINPITRTGRVSLLNNDRTFYIDGFAFPGNSGSPVFLDPGRLGGLPIEGHPYILGILGEYLPYRDEAISLQTKKTRVIFEENTGLARVWPITLIDEIIKTQGATIVK